MVNKKSHVQKKLLSFLKNIFRRTPSTREALIEILRNS